VRYRLVTIEGNIGAGKTSLAGMLAEKYNGSLILEQFADNPFLPAFYKNPKRNAFPLELFFLAERYQQMKEVMMADLFRSAVFTDYLFIKSFLFASINLKNEELKLYSRLFQIIHSQLPEPDLLLYLHSPVEKLLQNISGRGRSYEQNISAAYLEQIQETYFEYFKSAIRMKIVVADVSTIDFVNRPKDFNALCSLLEADYKPGLHRITL
jgi:deoxyadenosine/deoxycytidine kinase